MARRTTHSLLLRNLTQLPAHLSSRWKTSLGKLAHSHLPGTQRQRLGLSSDLSPKGLLVILLSAEQPNWWTQIYLSKPQHFYLEAKGDQERGHHLLRAMNPIPS